LSALTMASRGSILRLLTRVSRIRSWPPDSARRLATATEAHKTTPQPPPPPETSVSAEATISRIVDDISGLTLLQAADLVTQLKMRLNIQEIAIPTTASPSPTAAAAAAEEPVAEKPKEKTIFNFKLESFDAAAKPKVIREVKALVPNLTLMDAKKLVESAPKVLKENVSKEDAEKLKKAFESIGAVVKLE